MGKYLTDDNYILKQGQNCYVSLNDGGGKIFKAKFLDKTAKENGWDFTIQDLPDDLIEDVSIDKVWKYAISPRG